MAYLGNINLRSADQEIEYTKEMIEEYIKCSQDVIYFAEKFFHIVTIDEGKQLINLFEFQKKMLKVFSTTPEYQEKRKRHCIVKIARQSGKTTVATVYLLWYSLFNKDKTVAILANKETTAIEILDRIKLAYKHLPIWLQQGIVEGGWNKKSVKLSNGVKIMAASTSSDSISGEAVALLYMDEFAKVKHHIAEEFITATYPVITSGKTSKVIIVSTPVGLNHFYEFWTKAVRGKSNFYPVSVNWKERPGRDEEWKEETIADIGPVRFAQEFQCKFLGSQSTLIDSDVLECCAPIDPISTKWNGGLLIYEQPIPGQLYILGVDSAKGTGNDSSVIQVMRIINQKEVKQVAIYRNNFIIPHDYAQVCIGVSEYYNNAYMMIENNDVGSSVCDTIWYQFECGRLLNIDKKGLGIRSTRKSKLEANIILKEYMERGYLSIVDHRTIFELSRYEEVKPNVFACGREEHDDCVTSLIWSLYFLKTPYFDGNNMEVNEIDNKFKVDDDDDEGPIVFFE